MNLLSIAELKNQIEQRGNRMRILEKSIDQHTGTTYNVCFLPWAPTEAMIDAATAHGIKCHAEGIVPSGKSYYEAMVISYLAPIPIIPIK